MIEAGQASEIEWGGNWVFLDIGFAEKRKSCGLLFGDGHPNCLRFAEAKESILEHIRHSSPPVKLVIEAPLSACFDQHGNPKRRKIETADGKSRFWYVGAGCAVMVAAMYLIQDVHNAEPRIPVRLFEGFVSFKDSSTPTDHCRDVRLLRDVVRDPLKFSTAIYTGDDLKSDPTDRLVSAFRVAGLDLGVPAVIKPVLESATPQKSR